MGELNSLVTEIKEVRKENFTEKRMEDTEIIEEYVKEILKAFKISNEQKSLLYIFGK